MIAAAKRSSTSSIIRAKSYQGSLKSCLRSQTQNATLCSFLTTLAATEPRPQGASLRIGVWTMVLRLWRRPARRRKEEEEEGEMATMQKKHRGLIDTKNLALHVSPRRFLVFLGRTCISWRPHRAVNLTSATKNRSSLWVSMTKVAVAVAVIIPKNRAMGKKKKRRFQCSLPEISSRSMVFRPSRTTTLKRPVLQGTMRRRNATLLSC
mmetsp:Transcript_4164/g.6623  ORF Transcript_4164/g.6623 Transcript_4164/m.6623 type:complete len:208 (-) Transcript_4164:433-1056(-)